MFDECPQHNLFRHGRQHFESHDPQLSPLKTLTFVHPMDWWRNIDWSIPGLFILTGGRQIGKSTSVKLLIRHVLRKHLFAPTAIFYFPCDQIFDATQFDRVLRLFLDQLPAGAPFLLLIDEVTFVPDWDRVIKALADEGRFRRGMCVLTGSDSVILHDAAARFPGRRGTAAHTDFHLRPLSFREYVALVQPTALKAPAKTIDALFTLFRQYLHCGGFLRAINEYHAQGTIAEATYATFEQWIRGDCLKRGKNEAHLLALLQALLQIGVSQMSYSALTERVGSMSKETLLDYCRLLERMDVLCTLPAFDQNTRRGFPKKARKFHFCDPFIRATITRWLERERYATGTMDESQLVEATVAAQYARRLPTYYGKAAGEIDLMVVVEKHFLPIEIKWTRQVRPSDLAQLRKYPTGLLLTQHATPGTIDTIRTWPVPQFLVEYDTADTLRTLVHP